MKNNNVQSRINNWIFDTQAEGLPELLMLGYADLRSAQSLIEHVHSNAYEFVFIEKGQAEWQIGDHYYKTATGDVFHTKPGEKHKGSYDMTDPSRFWWMIIQMPAESLLEDWLGLNFVEQQQIINGLKELPRVVHTSMLTRDIFQRLKSALSLQDSFAIIERRLAVLDFLMLLLRQKTDKEKPDFVFPRLDKIITKISLHPEWRPSVSELADDCDISVPHFYRVFQYYTGLTPMNYLENNRMQEAYRYLKNSDNSITSIALDLGYASSQHFATIFRKRTGRTPSSWRQWVRKM